MKVVIMAGGKGTRISSVASDIPKPMIKVEGIPVLEREIECLKNQGFDDIILTVSHLGNIIMDYFGDGSGNSPVTGEPFGVHIDYYFEEEPLGNAGALFKIKDKLTSDFLLLNADAMFDVDFNRFVAFHRKHGGLVTLFTHPNSHPYDSGLIIANKNGVVEKWLTKEDERPTYYKNRVNAGLHVINPLGIEMGRYLAAPCGTYASRVMDIKNNSDTNYIICDGGIHHLKYHGQTMAMQIPEMEVLNTSAETKPYCICGSLCTVADVLVREVELPIVSRNDVILFHRCGAYSVTEGSALFLSRKMPEVYLYNEAVGLEKMRGFISTASINRNSICQG